MEENKYLESRIPLFWDVTTHQWVMESQCLRTLHSPEKSESTNPLTQQPIPQERNLSYTTAKSSKLAAFWALYTNASCSSAINKGILTLTLLWNSQKIQNYQYQSPAGHSSKVVRKSLTQFHFTKIHLSTRFPLLPKLSMNIPTKILYV